MRPAPPARGRLLRIVAAATILVLLSLLGPDAGAQQPGQDAGKPVPELSWKMLQGRWKVGYSDAELGGISGEAVVTDRSVSVKLRDPSTGEMHDLHPERSTIQDNTLILVLGAGSPRSARRDGLGYPEIAITVKSPQLHQFRITGGSKKVKVAMAPMPPTDVNRVEIRLKPASRTTLVGEWRYRVHPFIERAANGYGRAGILKKDKDGVWWSVGGETWSRPKPHVLGILPLEPQLAMQIFSDGTNSAYYGYPFGGGSASGSRTRTLFVFGKDLPRDWDERAETISKSPGVTYTEIARLSDYKAAEKRRLSYPPDVAIRDRQLDDFTRGRNLLRAWLKSEKRDAADKVDAVILRATFDSKVVPGWQRLSYGGSENAWLLQFGDNTAQIRFVRKIGPLDQEHEATDVLYAGEWIQIEIETRRKLPVESIPIIVGAAGPNTPINPKGKRGSILSGDGDGIPAIRSAENPRIFRTEFIRLDPRLPDGTAVPASKSQPYHILPGRTGTRIFATFGRPGLISLPPPMAKVRVYRSPASQAVGGYWPKWLSIAAACAGVKSTNRLATEQAEADKISSFLVNSGRHWLAWPGWMTHKVTVGQHAGMLLLRDTFVRRLALIRTGLARLSTDEQIRNFRRAIEPLVRQGQTPLTRISVTGPDGRPTSFDWTFEKAIIGDVHDLGTDEVERWAIAATREAIEKYLRLIEKTAKHAQQIDKCDVPELLKLTGYGFGEVARIAKSKLMRPAGKPLYWVPDYRARANVETVAYVADQVAVAERLAAAARQEASMAVSLAAIPVGLVAGLAGTDAAMVASFLWDTINVAATTQSEIAEKLARDQAYQFALGAAELTGMRHLEIAERRLVPWGAVLGRLFPGVALWALGAIADAPIIYRKFAAGYRMLQIARGRALLMQAGGIVPAAEAAPARIASVTEEVDDALAAARTAEASGANMSRAPPLEESSAGAPLDPEIESAIDMAKPRAVDLHALPQGLDDAFEDVALYLDHIEASDFTSEIDDAYIAEIEASAQSLGEGLGPPAWRAEVSDNSFALIRRLVNRGRSDLINLMDEAADRIAAQIDAANPLRRQLARQVLTSEENISPERFVDEVDRLYSLRPKFRGGDSMGLAEPSRTDVIDVLRDANWRSQLRQYGNAEQITITDPEGHTGMVRRGYDPQTRTLTMHAAFREWPLANPPNGWTPGPIEPMIEVPLPHSLSDRVPAIQFFTLRLMTRLGIRYASAGVGAIRQCIIGHIANFRTIVKLEYLRRLFHPNQSLQDIPEEEMSDMLMMTHSVRYAQRDLAAAGYRVTGARLAFDNHYGVEPITEHIDNFFPRRDWPESAAEFLARLRLSVNDEAGESFNIVLDVEPVH